MLAMWRSRLEALSFRPQDALGYAKNVTSLRAPVGGTKIKINY